MGSRNGLDSSTVYFLPSIESMTNESSTPSAERRTMKMQVSMDGLRHNLARSYIELVEMLNDTFKHDWEIDKHELADKLLSLRQDIGVLHCIYCTEREHFSDLSSETDKLDCIRFTPIDNE